MDALSYCLMAVSYTHLDVYKRQANKGAAFQVSLSCTTGNAFTSFSVIAGVLPLGLTITGPGNEEQLQFPSVWGHIDTNCCLLYTSRCV